MPGNRILDRLIEKIAIPEPEERRKLKIQSNRVEDAVLIFMEWAKDKYGWKNEDWEEAFKLGKEICTDLNLSSEEILHIQKFRIGGIFGFFISGLIHDLGGSFSLNLYPMSGLGYRFKGTKLEIFGDRMIYLGLKMRGGKVILHGNAGNYAGREMESGEIIINGSVKNWAGYGMKGGRLIIKGNAGSVLGAKMEGGEIVVYGEAGEWVGDDARGGRIEIRGGRPLKP